MTIVLAEAFSENGLASLVHDGPWRRWACVSAAAVLVGASLVAFPAYLPWMVACWAGWHTLNVARGKAGWVPLAACVVILMVKRVPWLPGVCGLVGTMAVAAALGAASRWIGSLGTRNRWVVPALVWIAWAWMAVDWQLAARGEPHVLADRRRPVVCLGDSLTFQIGPDRGYPEALQKMIRLPVVNLGQAGISTQDALKLLPAVVEANPQVVVVELGGHDYLKGYRRSQTRANLEKIIAASRQIGAEVVLIEIPRGIVTDPFAGLERELARRHHLTLIPDTAIRMIILWSPCAPPGLWFPRGWHLSDDGLHPNARGNQLLARSVRDALARTYGDEIRAPE